MKRIWLFGNAITFGLTLMFCASSLSAQIVFKREHSPLTFKYGGTDDRNGRLAEPSAIASIACGKYLLVADDKRGDLLVVDPNTGQIVRESLKIPDQKYQGSGLDWEAMTKDSENRYYLVGSHSYTSNSFLISFRLKGEGVDNPDALEIVDLEKDLDITVSFNQAKSKLAAAQVEGLAVWKSKGQKELAFGIREQWSATIRVYSAVISPGTKVLDLKPLFKFSAEKTQTVPWHLSSLEYLPDWGFLVVTSTESAGNPKEFYGNMFRFVSLDQINRADSDIQDKFRKITAPSNSVVFQKAKMKAEGLSVLSFDGKESIQVVIVYDNDQLPDSHSRIQRFDLTIVAKATEQTVPVQRHRQPASSIRGRKAQRIVTNARARGSSQAPLRPKHRLESHRRLGGADGDLAGFDRRLHHYPA